MLMERVTHSAEETRIVGEEIAKQISVPACVFLSGDLGAGKTVISSGIVNGLTRKNYMVTSPTFTILQEYQGEIKVNHFDLYRITDENELENIGIYEYLFDNNAVNIFEWPERANSISNYAENLYLVNILKVDDKKRKITFEKIK